MEGKIIFDTEKRISNPGFTLVEIVILIAILAIIITGVLGAFVNTFATNKSNEYYSKAYKALDSKLEELRSESFSSITDSTFTVDGLPSSAGTVTVTHNIEGQEQSGILLVEVTINWTFKKENQLKTSTYITNGGLKK